MADLPIQKANLLNHSALGFSSEPQTSFYKRLSHLKFSITRTIEQCLYHGEPAKADLENDSSAPGGASRFAGFSRVPALRTCMPTA